MMESSFTNPIACSEPHLSRNRDQAFRDLLLKLSHKLDSENVDQLGFIANVPISDNGGNKCTPLQLLYALWKGGSFCPFTCSRLHNLLTKIKRCDLVNDIVLEYMEYFPDRG